MTVWIVDGHTESSDHFCEVFAYEPTEEQVDAHLAAVMPEEYEEVGFTHWELRRCEVIERVPDSRFKDRCPR